MVHDSYRDEPITFLNLFVKLFCLLSKSNKNLKRKKLHISVKLLVEDNGFEPMTSTLPV